MNKSELMSAIAQAAGITNQKADEVIKALTNAVTETLKKGDKVVLNGFGSFEVSTRSARIGRNPGTGKEIKIAERIAPKFKAGKTLKDAVATIKSQKK